MRSAILATASGLAVLTALLCVGAGRPEARGQRAGYGSARSASDLQVVELTPTQQQRQVLIIDRSAQRMCVYQIDASSGELSLKSARNLRWDLQLEAFNNLNPAPQQIRSLVERP